MPLRSRFLLASILGLVVTGCAPDDEELRVVPARGGQGGGDTLRIEGSGFVGHGALTVYVGNRAAKMVVIEGPRLVTVVTPQSSRPEIVDVKMLFQDGTELLIEDGFEYEEQEGIVLQPELGG